MLKEQVYALARALESLGKVLGVNHTPGLVTELKTIEANLKAQVGAFDAALASGDLNAAAAIVHMPPLEQWPSLE